MIRPISLAVLITLFSALPFAATSLAAGYANNYSTSSQEDEDINPEGDLSDLIIEKKDGTTHRFQVELRDDNEGRAMGLMFRQELLDDHGMIFVFPRPGRQGFWMKNTLISLDMIFVRANGRIANILHDVPPQTLESRRSQGRVLAVLELKGGLAKKLGIEQGDIVHHQSLKNMITESN